MNTPILFEVCCGSAEDALAAWKGGAHRAELCSDLFHGGLTPTLGALRTVKKHAPHFPVICMVRPREGGFCYTDTEFEVILEDARLFLEHGADGIVFGFLKEDGTVDVDRCRRILEVIGPAQSVFHRAIDVTPDIMAALDQLIDLGITRVLTSGGEPTVPEGAATIRAMIERANGRIEIQPGGGINPKNLAWCLEMTGAKMFHASARRTAYDRSAMGNPAIHFGGAIYPPEDQYKVGHPEAAAAFFSALNE